MELLVLVVLLLLGLFLIPLGIPGIWLMVGTALILGPLTGQINVGWWTVLGAAALAGLAELIEFLLAGRYAQQYGGSRRSAWGAILGGVIGALVGVPIPIIGSMIGAFVGAFAGAWAMEMSRGTGHDGATRVATGALIGRIAAVAVKVGLGVVIAVWVIGVALLAPEPAGPQTPSPGSEGPASGAVVPA